MTELITITEEQTFLKFFENSEPIYIIYSTSKAQSKDLLSDRAFMQ